MSGCGAADSERQRLRQKKLLVLGVDALGIWKCFLLRLKHPNDNGPLLLCHQVCFHPSMQSIARKKIKGQLRAIK